MEDFYQSYEHLSEQEKKWIWSGIESEMNNHFNNDRGKTAIIHWRSFIIGNVAALLLVLASIGIYSIYEHVYSENIPTQYKIDKAYRSAMQQMVSVSPDIVKQASDVEKPVIESKIENIRNLDKMIKELQTDIVLNGSTTVKKAQLRRLYAMKMDYVKELLIAGKVNL